MEEVSVRSQSRATRPKARRLDESCTATQQIVRQSGMTATGTRLWAVELLPSWP